MKKNIFIIGCVTLLLFNIYGIEYIFKYKNPDAKSVHVAGSFNEFSVNDASLMKKDENGVWTKTLDLNPGKYKYKFVINGEEWVTDPNVSEKSDWDDAIIYIGNNVDNKTSSSDQVTVTLEYKNPDAGKVQVAGSFNDWLNNQEGKVFNDDYMMKKNGDGIWKIDFSLKPGTYDFKYVIDGGADWKNDPDKPKNNDGNSILNVTKASKDSSGSSTKKQTTNKSSGTLFEVKAPDAKTVTVAGSFNDWKTDKYYLQNDGNGNWSITLDLKPGKYEYKYLKDGDWDALNPSNRIIEVTDESATGGGFSNQSEGTLFEVNAPDAKDVTIAGSFNEWNPNQYHLKNNGSGNWSITLDLKPGKYEYKFLKDGDWDALNPSNQIKEVK